MLIDRICPFRSKRANKKAKPVSKGGERDGLGFKGENMKKRGRSMQL